MNVPWWGPLAGFVIGWVLVEMSKELGARREARRKRLGQEER